MISRNGKQNFFAAHWDWLVLGVGVAVLIQGVTMFFLASAQDPEDAAAAAVERIERAKPATSGVAPAELAEFQQAVSRAKNPAKLAAVPEGEACFLASEKRLTCHNAQCKMPIHADERVCPVCSTEQPEAPTLVFDTDEDGMSDEWEKRYGFNINFKGDAAEDADGDGFTNLEEYLAKTDPTDKKSHPDYFDSLRLELPLKETTLPFFFKSVKKTPSGVKYEFFDPKKKNDYGKAGFTYSVFEGKDIGDTGFKVKGYEQKSVKRRIKGSESEKTVDVSEATIERLSDHKQLKLVLEERNHTVDVQAHLVYERGETKEFDVVPGDSLSLNGEKYVVKAVEAKGKGGRVVLEMVVGGKTKVLEALER